MLAKLSALLSSKVAIAALGGALVLGGGATVAAAETGHLPAGVTIPGISHSQGDDSQGDNHDNNANHADVVAVQGTLTAYNATAHTITVTGKAEDSDENDNENDGDDNGKGNGTPTAETPGTGDGHEGTPTAHGTPGTGDGHEGTPTAHATSTSGTTCSLKSPFTIALNGDTKINGQAKSESDLKGNIGHGVEVQANEGTSCNLTAAKVTVQGKDDSSESEHHVVVGTVDTVGTSSFKLQPEQGNAIMVNVTSTTKFEGVKGLSGLTHGMRAAAMGTQQSDGSVTATMVVAEGNDDHGGGQGQKTEVGGHVASVDTAHNSFVVTTEDNHSATVSVTSATVYEGDVHGLADLKAGMGVAATGTMQSNGSLQATHVVAEASGAQG